MRGLALAVLLLLASCGNALPPPGGSTAPGSAPTMTGPGLEAIASHADDLRRTALSSGDPAGLYLAFGSQSLRALTAAVSARARRGDLLREELLDRGLVHWGQGPEGAEVVLVIRSRQAGAGVDPSAGAVVLRQWWARLAWRAGRWYVVGDRDLSPPEWWAAVRPAAGPRALRSGTGSAASAAFGLMAGVGGLVAGVTWYGQQHNLDCEAAALEIALSHEGLSPSQDDLLRLMAPDGLPGAVDFAGNLHWGDPYARFVGSPDGHEYDLTGYGAYWPVLARAARAAGGIVLAAGEGIAAPDDYAFVAGGHPVIARVTFDWGWHPRRDYRATDGRLIPFLGPFDHVVVLIGVRVDAVLVADPDGAGSRPDHPLPAEYWVPKAVFEMANRLLGSQAVALR